MIKALSQDKPNTPTHIGIIMDGNGRWAKKRGLPRKAGHKAGADTFVKIAKHCKKRGIKYLTVYAFSTENWKRPKDEVNSIMNLIRSYLEEQEKHQDEDVKTIFIGDRAPLDDDLQVRMGKIETQTRDKTGITVLIALNYGGRAEIAHACKLIAKDVENKKLCVDEIDENVLKEYLYTKGIPNPDLVIRPSGEQRLSNFLIWQNAYAEYVFMDILWPDFKEKDLDKALEIYQSRNRRFGGI